MTLLAPKISEIYSIGTIIEANVPSSGKWLPCQGQILAQSDYPALFAMMDNPYSMIFTDFEFTDNSNLNGLYPYAEKCTWNGSTGSPIWVGLNGDSDYLKSTDGINWTGYSMPVSGTYYCASNGSVFCAVKYGSTQAYTSSNGFTWSPRTLPYAYNWTDIVWDGTNFIAFASNNVQTIKSSDGITWSDGGVLVGGGSYYYGATDGAGTIVVIQGGKDINTSVDGGANWIHVEATQGAWNSIDYGNGYFLIATDRSYVGVSSDGLDWDWIPYYSDRFDSNDLEMNEEAGVVWRWKYHAGIYFGTPKGYSSGVYSFDLRTFHHWHSNPYFGEMYDVIYNSVSGNLTVFGGYGYSMPYSKITGRYDSSTHFQLPSYFKHKFYEREKNRYIKVL
jgi:hypothetical protein